MNEIIYRYRKTILLGVGVLCLGLIALYFFTTASYSSFKLEATHYKSSMFSTLQGDDIYSYNGLSFYKSPTGKAGETVALNTGLRLPEINTLQWGGDEGALLTFSEAGFFSSALEPELVSRGLPWDETTQKYLWFLDFSTSKFHLVSTKGFSGVSTYYDADKKGFYYAETSELIPESDIPGAAPLYFYSTSVQKPSKILDDVGIAEQITYIGKCRDTGLICYIQSSEKKSTLWIVEGVNKKSKHLSDTYDIILATGSPNKFIGLKNTQLGYESSDEVVLQAETYLINLSNNSVSDLDNSVAAGSSLFANTTASESFYIFDANPMSYEDNLTYLTGGKNVFGTIKTKREVLQLASKTEYESRSVSGVISHSNSGLTLFSDVEGDMFLVAPKNYSVNISTLSSSDIEKGLKNCFDTYTRDHSYSDEFKQFKISIPYDANFLRTMKSFGDCANEQNVNINAGYSFVFIGIDSDGRFVTD